MPDNDQHFGDDASLVEAALSGSKQAFHEIYIRYRKRMLLTGMAILRHKEDSEDCVFNVFATILKPGQLATLARDPNPNLGAFLAKAVRNEALQLLRRRQTKDGEAREVQQPIDDSAGSQKSTEEWLTDISSAFRHAVSHNDPEKAIEEEQLQIKFRECMKRLSDASQETLRAYLYCIIETDRPPSFRALGRKLGVCHHTAQDWLNQAGEDLKAACNHEIEL
ncbi:hypothetical protein U5801_21550 [Lamprobacter modestohalophilus]|uniref:RNA polymerase sigma factor n=1 Tax=Lamprobacter modestohalophilus TaxID=1064514 RepID=UPI002ADEAC77|nr:hypothetical protein [Lamprobacter modestohalophilus]MEA1052370.1 hypothetical protein [Lamprobacter modestohalophilus]